MSMAHDDGGNEASCGFDEVAVDAVVGGALVSGVPVLAGLEFVLPIILVIFPLLFELFDICIAHSM
jgi:hypothetical protein